VSYSLETLYSLTDLFGAFILGQQDQFNHQQRQPIDVDLGQDLRWLLHSQPLMRATPSIGIFAPKNIDYQSTPPLTHLAHYPPQPAYRLGKHFEDCVDLLFAGSASHHIINRNIVIQAPERTLGELDLLYRNNQHQVVHLELAIKYYLLEKGGTQLAHFVGPAGIDRLDLKWQRLCEHQLPLSQTQQVKDYLTAHSLPLPSHQQLLLTGMLFYAYQDWQHTHIDNLGINPAHHRGWWLGHNELDQLQPTHAHQRGFILLPKWHWIGGPLHYPSAEPIAYDQLYSQATADPWPTMVLVYERSNTNMPWAFKHRGLVLDQ